MCNIKYFLLTFIKTDNNDFSLISYSFPSVGMLFTTRACKSHRSFDDDNEEKKNFEIKTIFPLGDRTKAIVKNNKRVDFKRCLCLFAFSHWIIF